MKNIIFILLFFPISLYSQTIVLGGGVGSYRMEDVKVLRDHLAQSSPVDLELVNDFPPHIFWGGKLLFGKESVKAGVGYNFYTTGSRNTSSDYSGRYDLDVIVNGHTAILPLFVEIIEEGDLNIGFYNDIECVFTKVKVKEYVEVYEESFENSEELNSVALGIEPGGYIEWPLNRFSINLNVGYNFSFFGVLKDEEGDELYFAQNDKMNTDWSGFRAELSVSFNLY